MLIGIDASRANEIQKTGVGWYAFFVIEELKKTQNTNNKTQNGEPVKFVLYTREPLKGELAVLPENWTVKVLRWTPKWLWTQVRLSWEMLWRAPDVLFVPAHVFPIIHPKKTVMTIHDVAAIKFPKSYGWFERWYSVWSARVALRRLWRVIVPTQAVKEELLQVTSYKIQDTNKIVVVRHGYDVRYEMRDEEINGDNEIFPPEADQHMAGKKYNIKKPYILSIGRLEEKKNTIRIIKAFEKIRSSLITDHLSLILVGNPGHGYEKVREAIDNSQFKSDIITPCWVSKDDLPAFLRGASVFVFPSLAEGFGMPILEAMAAGVPVVASRGGALQEVGVDACVYVDPLNVEEIANAILKLQIQNYKSQIVERGLARVKDFSWEKCAMETMSCLMS